MEMERFKYRAGEEDVGAVALVLDLAKAVERVSLPVVCVTGDHLFVMSVTCSVLSCFAVSDCRSPSSVICVAFCADACWLKANQSVFTHEMSFVCFVMEKGFH